MNKKWSIILAVLTSAILLASCGSEKEVRSDEEITNPQLESMETTQTAAEDNMAGEFETKKLKSGDGWIDVYAPHVSNRIRGITYCGDNLDEDWNHYAYGGVNRPDGCSYIKQSQGGFNLSFCTQNGKIDIDCFINRRFDAFVVHHIDSTDVPKDITAKDYVGQMAMTYQDVGCITLALYEDFYDDLDPVKITLYGITDSLWKEKLGNDMVFSYAEYMNFKNRCIDNNECTIIMEREVNKTGVYYVDYKKLFEEGNYKQYIWKFDFGDSEEFAYYIHGDCTYEITDQSNYEIWKNAHSEQFLAGM